MGDSVSDAMRSVKEFGYPKQVTRRESVALLAARRLDAAVAGLRRAFGGTDLGKAGYVPSRMAVAIADAMREVDAARFDLSAALNALDSVSSPQKTTDTQSGQPAE